MATRLSEPVNLGAKRSGRDIFTIISALTRFRSSKVFSSGDIPPCTQKKRPSTRAAMGNAQNDLTVAS
jgi:hypothetical protein